MVDRHIIEQRLAAVRDRLVRIRDRLPVQRAAFLADRDAQELVAFNLFLAFQDALDLAAHPIAGAGWAMPATAREHFEILARQRLLGLETAQPMARCAGLRNLIADVDGGLDLGRLYDELPAGVRAIESFSADIAAAVAG